MDELTDAGVMAGPAPGRTSYARRLRRLAGNGLVAVLAAVVATTLAAAVARAAGVDFELRVRTD